MSFDRVTAQKIKSLLTEKHKEEIFVTECKMGSAGSKILDGWAMKKTWSPISTIGYEIKVSRSDFLQDNKWQNYLDACHEFYFICPWKLIQKDELPDHVGLMWVSQNGTRIYTKRKAVRRKEIVDDSLLFYILMHRVKIISSTFGSKQYEHNEKRYWELWLKEKELDRQFGRMVSESISRRVTEEIERVQRDNEVLRRENETLQRVKKMRSELSEMGISDWDLKRIIDKGIGAVVEKSAARLQHDINSLKRSIEMVENEIKLETMKLNGKQEATL